MQKNFVRGLSRGPLDPAARTWAGAAELTLLRLVGIVWSTSDLSHPVAAAAMLLISQYLSQSRVRTLGDLASGLFLCSLVAQYETLSKRVVPESLNFLINAFLILVPTSLNLKTIPESFPSPDFGQEHVKALRLKTSKDLTPQKLSFGTALKAQTVDDQLKVDLAATTIILLKDSAEKYVSKDAFIELFHPVSTVLEKVSLSKLPQSLRVSCLLFSPRELLLSFLINDYSALGQNWRLAVIS